ncbi:MAG: glutamate-1-semialdehyde-2,1-aminomutase [Verrucomicrobiae bacterium]|nr:glutamate-1-semialdehyde-2,1-aminomutase [Verrucomicrobiae bacterium]
MVTKTHTVSEQLFEKASHLIPGGVNSPVRAFRGVGGNPFFVQRARGSRIWDVDGNEYIDYVGSWGPMILGHAQSKVVRSIQEVARDGTSFGIPNPHEVRLAQLVVESFPGIQKVRFVSSGTEATMSAIRLARGFTRRDKIVKFDGCYHGHVDSLLVKAGSGATTFGQPDSAGIPADLARHTISVPFNSESAVRDAVTTHKGQIAAIIVEPIPANAGLFLPQPGFLESLRKIATENGIVLIFDEVISGFRVARGGAQELYGIQADLTCLGKIIGGGLPVGALGGSADIMDQLAPLGPVYQAGTLSGNPLAMAAGVTTLSELFATNPYKNLEATTKRLAEGLGEAAKSAGVPIFQTRVGSIFCSFFTSTPVTDYASAKISDTKKFAAFFHAMLQRGVYLAPSQYEVGFVSTAHSPEDIAETVRVAREAFQAIR